MFGTHYSRRARAALILGDDPLAAALIGFAVELGGMRPVYPRAGESLADAIRREKPALVMVEASHEAARDAAALGPAIMTGASLIIFGASETVGAVRVAGAAAHATMLRLPEQIAELSGLLRAAAAAQPGRRQRSE